MIDLYNPIFVHSDIGRGVLAIKRKGAKIDSKNICSSILEFLSQQVDGELCRVIFPGFNYDYGKTRVYKPDSDPVQVGALPEWIRTNCEFNRSNVPFFSVLSKSKIELKKTKIINPFGPESIFGHLVSNDATIVLLGTGLCSLTFIHHVEEIVGKPCYRYKKSFPGQIINSKKEIYDCEYAMHVRPLGVNMDYDWKRLTDDLLLEGILNIDNDTQDLKYIKAQRLIEYWGNRLNDDPFYLLDTKSKAYFMDKTLSGSRRVQIEDYES